MTSCVVGLGLELFEGASDIRALADAVLRFFAATGTRPDRITYRNPYVKTLAFRPKTFSALLDDPLAPSVTLSSDSEEVPSVNMFLRFVPDPELPLKAQFDYRRFGVTLPVGSATALPAVVLDLARAVISLAPVVQGCAGAFDHRYTAAEECWRGGTAPDEETRLRLKEDAMSWTSKRRRLRRLYPVTIIGPELWAELPPMPAFERMPVVEELGNCKMVTAWPVLCGPRDPEFLRGTRELRAWLWPYTIQNPADHVDQDPAPTRAGARQ